MRREAEALSPVLVPGVVSLAASLAPAFHARGSSSAGAFLDRTARQRDAGRRPHASYHNGSVWPHDNGLIALGLARYGHCSEALELTTALFDAAAHMHLRRLPELFCGFERKRGKAPVLYPVACAPQAWAAVTPFALIQACLGLEIDCGAAKLRLRKPRLLTLLARNGAAEVEVML